MPRRLLICCGLFLALTAPTAVVEAAAVEGRLCEPGEPMSLPAVAAPALAEPSPEQRCVPGLAASPDCELDTPANAPGHGATSAPVRWQTGVVAGVVVPGPVERPLSWRAGTDAELHPGYARRIDRPPRA